MTNGTTPRTVPFLEGSPTQPDWIRLDSVASGEWARICGVLEARRGLSPAWVGIISVAATAYAHFVHFANEVQACEQDVDGADELLGSMLSTYRAACTACLVEPNPVMRLRIVPFVEAFTTEDIL